jgi:hypothetical protein
MAIPKTQEEKELALKTYLDYVETGEVRYGCNDNLEAVVESLEAKQLASTDENERESYRITIDALNTEIKNIKASLAKIRDSLSRFPKP